MKAALYMIIASVLVVALGLQYLYFAPQLSPATPDPLTAPVLPGPLPPSATLAEGALPEEDYCADDEPCIVSLRLVLQNAARYDGRRVLAFGVLEVGDELTALFVDPPAHRAGRRDAAVVLVLPRHDTAPEGWALREQQGGAVLVEGRFAIGGPLGHAGMLGDIRLMRPGSFF